MDPDQFVTRWQKAAAAERANYQLFISEYYDILGIPRPDPATGRAEAACYVFKKPVTCILAGHNLTPTSENSLDTINANLTGRNTSKRRTQIQSVLATLQSLGQA